MKQTLLLGGLVLAGATLGAMPPDAPNPPSLVPAAEARVAPADTLQRRVTAGDDLIVTLPDALSGHSVTSYALVRAPAMSWLVDRSLLWRTRPDDAGSHTLLVEATFASAPPDTLTILVDAASGE